MIARHDDASDQAESADDATRDAPVAVNVSPEEIVHNENLSQPNCVASGANLRQTGRMNLTNESFLWASLLWGAVAGGYLVYGWRQKSGIPLAAGAAMTFMSFVGPNALVMSLVCVAVMGATWWLSKQGY
jgi:hypothetical protein